MSWNKREPSKCVVVLVYSMCFPAKATSSTCIYFIVKEQLAIELSEWLIWALFIRFFSLQACLGEVFQTDSFLLLMVYIYKPCLIASDSLFLVSLAVPGTMLPRGRLASKQWGSVGHISDRELTDKKVLINKSVHLPHSFIAQDRKAKWFAKCCAKGN